MPASRRASNLRRDSEAASREQARSTPASFRDDARHPRYRQGPWQRNHAAWRSATPSASKAALDLREKTRALGRIRHEKSGRLRRGASHACERHRRGDDRPGEGTRARGLEAWRKSVTRYPAVSRRRARGSSSISAWKSLGDDPVGTAETAHVSLPPAGGLSFKIGGGNVVTLCPPLTIPFENNLTRRSRSSGWLCGLKT